MKKHLTFATVAALAALAQPMSAIAADVFQVTATVDGALGYTTSASAGFKSAEDVFNSLTDQGLRNLNPAYTGSEKASVTINFRGLPMVAGYEVVGTSKLVFSIPSLGIKQAFEGATRDQSQDQFEEYIKHNKDDILNRMFRELARVSPVDPVAGNPNSLMSRLVSQDFQNGGARAFVPQGGGDGTGNLISAAPSTGSFKQDGIRSTAVTLPLSYIVRSDMDPRRQFGLHLPVTMIDTAGSKAYSIAPSLMYRHPVNDDWALSPAVGLGVTGSTDLASLASIWSATLTSSYVMPVGGFDLTISNMVGRYETLKVKSGDYSANPGISNTVLKNGVTLTQPVPVLDGMGSVEYSYANTRFFGTALYIEQYNEFGVSIGTNRSARSARSYFRAGLSYLHSDKSKGFALNAGFWF